MYKELKFLAAGDSGLVVEVGNEISEDVNMLVRNLMLALEKDAITGVKEMVPTYRSLMIYYHPLIISCEELKKKILLVQENLQQMDLPSPRTVFIPTLYGGEKGVDLEFVSRHSGLTTAEVIKIHTRPRYLVYMLGFTPGFCYLGGLPEEIATPRLANPRTKIPAGSVGIAGNQTGIYPVESPGGWQLIGQTPLKLYDPYASQPILLRAGDYLKFYAISEEEFNKIQEEIAQNRFKLCTSD